MRPGASILHMGCPERQCGAVVKMLGRIQTQVLVLSHEMAAGYELEMESSLVIYKGSLPLLNSWCTVCE